MQRGVLSSAPAQPGPSSQADLHQAYESNLQECLNLLRGPTDERRFVGLLMVTRALPAGDEATIREVYDAMGPTFMTRMLLPLRATPAPPGAPLPLETAQKHVATAAAGLAVLSSFAKAQDIAAREEVVRLLPLLLSTIRAGGVTPLLSRHARGRLLEDPSIDESAVKDAMEAAVAILLASKEGMQVGEESGALQAAAQALMDQSSSTRSTEIMSWGVHLASAVLSCDDRARILENQSETIARLIPGLCRIFARPALRLTQSSGNAAASNREDADETRQQRQEAAAHLQAMHTLLSLLPLAAHLRSPDASAVHDMLLPPGGHMQSQWLYDIRRGVYAVLRGRASAVHRLDAVQLAAAVASMAGPRWLFAALPHAGTEGDQDAYRVSEEGQDFFQLIVEVTKIEVSVLLYDALAPAAPVPRRSEVPGVTTSSKESLEDGDGDGDGERKAPSNTRPMERDIVRRPTTASDAKDSGDDDACLHGGGSLEPSERHHESSQPAGERAMRALPVCLELFEAEIEALAIDAIAVEPCITASVAQKALLSLNDTADVLLQYLQQVLVDVDVDYGVLVGGESERSSVDSAAAASISNVDERTQYIAIAAVRAIGRYCAEVPDAFSAKLRNLLPRLLDVGGDATTASTASFGATNALFSNYRLGVQFLLPLLVQATDAKRDLDDPRADASAWARAIVETPALQCIAGHAAAIASRLERALSSQPTNMEPSDVMTLVSSMHTVATVLAQVADNVDPTLGGNVVETTQKRFLDTVCTSLFGATVEAVNGALLRLCQLQNTNNIDALHAAGMVACVATLLAVLLLAKSKISSAMVSPGAGAADVDIAQRDGLVCETIARSMQYVLRVLKSMNTAPSNQTENGGAASASSATLTDDEMELHRETTREWLRLVKESQAVLRANPSFAESLLQVQWPREVVLGPENSDDVTTGRLRAQAVLDTLCKLEL